MLPSDHYTKTVKNYAIRPLRWLGVSYLRTGSFIQANTLVIWAVVLGSWICMMYTMTSKDAHTAMKCSTVASVAMQGTLKFYVLYMKSDNLRHQFEYLVGVFRQCEHHPREAARLYAWQPLVDFMVIGFVVVMIVNMIGFSLSPVYMYYVQGVRETPLPMALPYVDDQTPSGYVLSSAFQLCNLCIGVTGTIGFDLSILLLLMGICMTTDIMMLKLLLLAEGLRDGGPKVADRHETRAFLHNMVRLHVEFTTHLDSMATMFYGTFIVEIGLDSLSMCLILFVLTQLTWLPLYAYFVCFIVKAFFACMMGTMIKIYVCVCGHARSIFVVLQ